MDDLREMPCPICGEMLQVKVTRSRKDHVALMLVCPTTGKHFRGFINDQDYIEDVIGRLDGREKRNLAKLLERDDADRRGEKEESGWERVGRLLGLRD